MLLAVNLNLVAFSAFHGDLVGQVFAMIVLTVAAAEAAIGLAIVVVYFRNRGTIDVAEIDLSEGLAPADVSGDRLPPADRRDLCRLLRPARRRARERGHHHDASC